MSISQSPWIAVASLKVLQTASCSAVTPRSGSLPVAAQQLWQGSPLPETLTEDVLQEVQYL